MGEKDEGIRESKSRVGEGGQKRGTGERTDTKAIREMKRDKKLYL